MNHLIECRNTHEVSVQSFMPELKRGLLQERNLNGAVYFASFTKVSEIVCVRLISQIICFQKLIYVYCLVFHIF